jgi:hypothetical protein
MKLPVPSGEKLLVCQGKSFKEQAFSFFAHQIIIGTNLKLKKDKFKIF